MSGIFACLLIEAMKKCCLNLSFADGTCICLYITIAVIVVALMRMIDDHSIVKTQKKTVCVSFGEIRFVCCLSQEKRYSISSHTGNQVSPFTPGEPQLLTEHMRQSDSDAAISSSFMVFLAWEPDVRVVAYAYSSIIYYSLLVYHYFLLLSGLSRSYLRTQGKIGRTTNYALNSEAEQVLKRQNPLY